MILSSSFCSVRLAQDIRIKGLERQFKLYGLFCIALPLLIELPHGVRLRARLLSSVL